jgi:hypothetical protein
MGQWLSSLILFHFLISLFGRFATISLVPDLDFDLAAARSG